MAYQKQADLSKVASAYDIARKYFKSVGTPYALSLLNLSIDKLGQARKPDPLAYDNHLTFARDYACYTFLRKYKGASNDKVLTEKAIKVFKETEATVRRTNVYLESGGYASRRGVGSCISAARLKVQEILGRFNADEWFDGCEWGPGATSSLSTEKATLDKKILERRISVTAGALPFFRRYLECDIHMFAARLGFYPEGPYSVLETEFSVVESSRLTTVEKTINERRIIDIQPTANLFLQKGIGRMIRRRLQRFGIDLDDQSRNQWLASVAGRLQLSTIDLASASDTVSHSLVRLLLPEDWYVALCSLRTNSTLWNKRERIYLNKFSAMGNGYTFELESLIFYALCRAVSDLSESSDPIGIYGDDIIVSYPISRNVIRLLEETGFKINSEKSFLSGRFFESCGKHYFDGYDVTPLYQKEKCESFVSYMRLANRIFRHANRVLGDDFLDHRSMPAWHLAISAAKAHWMATYSRKFGDMPVKAHWVEGDDAVIYDVPMHQKNGMCIYKGVKFSAVKRGTDSLSIYATVLRQGSSESPSYGFVSLRRRTRMVVKKKLKVSYLPTSFPSVI